MSFSKIKFIIILITVGLVAYLPSLNNKFIWDDEQFIYNNSYVKNFEIKKIFSESTTSGAGVKSTYYRPLTTLSFAIDHQIWQLKPFGFHLTNTFLHVMTGIILFLFIINLGISKNKSFWISAIFLSHPLQTEAVVYANSRGDSMYAFWSILSLLAFSFLCLKKYPKIQIYNLTIKLGKVYLIIFTTIFYLLSILGKEIGIASLGLFFITFLKINSKNLMANGKNLFPAMKNMKLVWSKNYLQIATLFSLVLTAISYLIFRNKILNIPTIINTHNPLSEYDSNIFIRLHTFTKALWQYFGLIFLPISLHMERSLEVISKPVSIWLIATIILFISILIISYFEFKKQKTIFTLFGFSWFIIMLIPVSGIVPINGLIYEHWLYTPIIGFTIFILGIITTISNKKLNKILKQFLPVLIFIYIALTIKQNYIWGDPIRFYNYTLKFNQTARIYNNLAMSYADIGQNKKAIQAYKKSIEIFKFYPQTHHNLGNVYLSENELNLAEQSFKTAISLNDNFLPSYGPLINILIKKEKFTEALPLVKKFIENNNHDLEANLIYLDILYKVKNIQAAKIQLENIKTLFPNNKRSEYLTNKILERNEVIAQ